MYGANLTAASLPGKGHSILHNQLQSLIQVITQLRGVLSEKEPGNTFLGKVGEAHLMVYVNLVVNQNNGNRRAKHVNVPDIHINEPLRWQAESK